MCFEIVHRREVIALRASSVANKRKWLNHLDAQCSAIAANVKRLDRARMANKGGQLSPSNAIGTLQVTVHEAQNLVQPAEKSRIDIFVAASIDHHQVSKTKSVRDSLSPKFGQALLFTIHSLDDPVRMTVYNSDKYSSDGELNLIWLLLWSCLMRPSRLQRFWGLAKWAWTCSNDTVDAKRTDYHFRSREFRAAL
jgi:hypothetical protein